MGALAQDFAAVEAPSSSLRMRRRVWFVLAVALAARLLMLQSIVKKFPHNWLFGRGIEMGLLADSLLHGLGYSSPFGGSTGPTAFIAPGYPTLVAAFFFIFGTYSFASEIAILVFHILLALLTIWLMMRLAQQEMSGATATLAGIFWAVSVPLVWIPTIFWETSLSACAMVGSAMLALWCRRRMTAKMWVAAGACVALAALINPAMLPMLVAILGWLAFQTRRAGWKGPALGLLTLLLVFSPWPIRNAYRFHAFIPLRSTVGFELWMGNRPGATGFLDESLFPSNDKQELASYLTKGEVAYTRGKSQAAEEYIRARPGVFAAMTCRRIFRFWTGTGNAASSPFYALHAVLTTVFGAGGLGLLFWRRRWSFAVLMMLPLLLFPLPYYITHAEFRYRLVIDPLMTVLAAYAVTQLAGALRSKRVRAEA